MEQIQQLIEILKSTPEMALWGLAIWCFYILAKLSSVVYAIKAVCQLAINKWHDYKIKLLSVKEKELELQLSEKDIELKRQELENIKSKFKYDENLKDIKKLASKFDKAKITDVEMDELSRLLDTIKSTTYIHESDIKKAIKTIENSRLN